MSYEIKKFDENVNYWVVRAGKGGEFLNVFIENNIVGINHLNKLEVEHIKISTKEDLGQTLDSLANILISEKTSSSISTIQSQIKKFINDINVGDIVISVDDTNMVSGVITSEAYIDNNDIIRRDANGNIIGHRYDQLVRRKVEWNLRQSKKNIPQSIKTSLKANQTVFNVNDNWKQLNHWLAVFFEKDNSLYFSTRIETDNPIYGLDVSDYSLALMKAEAFSQYIDDLDCLDDLDNLDDDEISKIIDEIDNLYAKMRKDRVFSITTQQSFMSPGDYWGEVKGSSLKRIAFMVVLSSLLNFDFSYSSDISTSDAVMINSLAEKVSEKISDDNNVPLIVNNLSLNIPKQVLKNKYPESEMDNDIGM